MFHLVCAYKVLAIVSSTLAGIKKGILTTFFWNEPKISSYEKV